MIIRRQWVGSARVLQVLNLIGPEGPIAPGGTPGRKPGEEPQGGTPGRKPGEEPQGGTPGRNPREETRGGNPGRNPREETRGGQEVSGPQAPQPHSTTGPTAPQHHRPHSHSTQCARSINTFTSPITLPITLQFSY